MRDNGIKRSLTKKDALNIKMVIFIMGSGIKEKFLLKTISFIKAKWVWRIYMG